MQHFYVSKLTWSMMDFLECMLPIFHEVVYFMHSKVLNGCLCSGAVNGWVSVWGWLRLGVKVKVE